MWVYFSYIFTFALRHAHTQIESNSDRRTLGSVAQNIYISFDRADLFGEVRSLRETCRHLAQQRPSHPPKKQLGQADARQPAASMMAMATVP